MNKWQDKQTLDPGRIAASGKPISFGPNCMGPRDARFMGEGYRYKNYPPKWLR